MSVKLVNIAKDQVRSLKMRNMFGCIEPALLLIMSSSLSCFFGDVEEVAFLETVKSFLDTFKEQYFTLYTTGRKQIQYDLLIPILDYLREYGSAFATPLFERVLDSATTVKQDE